MHDYNYFIRINGKHGKITVNIRSFIIIQMTAVVFLFTALIEYKNVHETYEKKVAYLPVTVTYTASYPAEYIDAEGNSHKNYINQFQYEVEGVIYHHTAHDQSIRAIRGTQDTWYYNPDHPEQIGRSPSLDTASGPYKILFFIYAVIQITAIIRLVCEIYKEYRYPAPDGYSMGVLEEPAGLGRTGQQKQE